MCEEKEKICYIPTVIFSKKDIVDLPCIIKYQSFTYPLTVEYSSTGTNLLPVTDMARCPITVETAPTFGKLMYKGTQLFTGDVVQLPISFSDFKYDAPVAPSVPEPIITTVVLKGICPCVVTTRTVTINIIAPPTPP